MISSIRWCPDTETWDSQTLTEDKKSHGLLQLKHKATVLIAYCRKVLSRTEDDTTWVAVFAVPEGDADKPNHVHSFPFPFQLPLYPRRPLFFVKYIEKTVVRAPFVLGPAPKAAAVIFQTLDLDEWALLRKTFADGAEDAKAVYEMLQAAFDSSWVPEHDSDDEFVADEEVETDLLLLQSATAASTSVATIPSVMPDDDWVEDEDAETDAITGFVVEKDAHSDGVCSDSDDNCDDDDEEDEDEEDEDEEDVEDDIVDDDDDAGELDCSGIPL